MDKLKLFRLLGFLTTGLAITAMLFSLQGNWRYVAGFAVLACVFYQIRIWLIVQVCNKM